MSDRKKAIKIFAGAPLEQYFNTAPTKRDTTALFHSLSNPFKKTTGWRERRDKAMEEAKNNPTISPSVTVNRLAERMLWLRTVEFPFMSYEGWEVALNTLNGRYELSLEAIDRFISDCADEYEITNDNFDPATDTGFGELVSLSQVQRLLVCQFSEYHWGSEAYKERAESTGESFEETLGFFFERYAGHCLKDPDYTHTDHWETPKFVFDDLYNEQALQLSHRSGATYLVSRRDNNSIVFRQKSAASVTLNEQLIHQEISLLAEKQLFE
ncbi:hypothetical protein [Enterovibrio norvegicus]|uniref:hypothetical protein n=1 Tax=Enterovibrio norvegicus TaxID=188144 RepID=UPI000C836BB3|nr:hypothetical protein [Enterovibrio norvegicus]PMH64489.1 hypothetical protein BCU62_15660 [Enterovibrio norvegicus]